MVYTIELARDAEYNNVTFIGTPTIKEMEASRAEINDALVTYNWNKVLVEGNNNKPKLSLYEHAKFTKELLSIFPTDVYIAIIHNWEFEVDDLLVKKLARNYGLNLKFFSSKYKALSWLLTNR
ncbi:MAG TPA: hypothetical protein VMW91_07900 [Desulfosporosinus sp.]|nr:hypothetical protein [Desulfosporosinus sp.]HUU39919.1 hypothetical protein [Desulfatiglandales bacterium]